MKIKSKLIIGLMSGTSVDGVDTALVSVSGKGLKTKIALKDFITYPFPKGMKEMIIENAETNGGNVTSICQLNFLIAHVYALAVKKILKKNNLNPEDIYCIGSHGQTIHHLPNKVKMFGLPGNSTLQIGDPSVLAKLTGILTVGDFRVGDIALGGKGAPLIPYYDYVLFRSNKINRALLNIGGIANITVIPKNSSPTDVVAFDTGPGNMLIDQLMKSFFNKNFDNNGKTAFKGKINLELLADMIEQDSFIYQKPPKSTGREYYGKYFLTKLLKKYSNIPKEDWITTVSEYTVLSVYLNYKKFIERNFSIYELIVSGGGANNNYIMNGLKNLFGKKTKVFSLDEKGFSSDAKEAMCFALLANETLNKIPSNIPKVTGAKKETILGKICFP